MARVFITGSSTGLGHLAGGHLLSAGHEVVLHARDEAKAARLRGAFPAAGVVVGDLERIDGIRAVAATADRLGPYRSVIHNAGVLGGGAAGLSADGLPVVFAVNALAPYLLTALMSRPERLIFLGSSMHLGARLTNLREAWDGDRWRRGDRLFRLQAGRDRLRHGRRAAVARGAGQRGRSRLGPNADGRSLRPGRPGGRLADPGLACHQRRPRSPDHRAVPLPSPQRPVRPGGPRHQFSGGRPCALCRDQRHGFPPHLTHRP